MYADHGSPLLPTYQHVLSRSLLDIPLAIVHQRNNPKLDRYVDFFYDLHSNSAYILMSGGNDRREAEFETFENNCNQSMLHVIEVIEHQAFETNKHIPQDNMLKLSPYVTPKLTTDIVIEKIEYMKRKHQLKPFRALFLYIVGHDPNSDKFYVSEECRVSLAYLKSTIQCFSNCELLAIIKDFCFAEAFDLLPVSNNTLEGKHWIQWSCCTSKGKSYTFIPNSRLFSHCITTAFKGLDCPIKMENCLICAEYRKWIHNKKISYKMLQYWIEKHFILLKSKGVTDCDMPVLELR